MLPPARPAAPARPGTAPGRPVRRGRALPAGLEPRLERTGEPSRDDGQHRAGGHRGAFDDPVDGAVEAAVAAAPDLDARRAPFALVAEPPAQAASASAARRAARRCARRRETRRRAAPSRRSPSGSRGRRSAPGTTRDCRRADDPPARCRRATCAPAPAARGGRSRRSPDPPTRCARPGSRRPSRTSTRRGERARRRGPGARPQPMPTAMPAPRALGSSARSCSSASCSSSLDATGTPAAIAAVTTGWSTPAGQRGHDHVDVRRDRIAGREVDGMRIRAERLRRPRRVDPRHDRRATGGRCPACR